MGWTERSNFFKADDDRILLLSNYSTKKCILDEIGEFAVKDGWIMSRQQDFQ